MKNFHNFLSEWNSINSLNQRELGIRSNRNFQKAGYSATSIVKCLAQTHSLEYHDGCVNAVNFSPSGELIASGSDDLQVAIWDWLKYTSKPKISYPSGHGSNIFQTKFMEHSCESTIVTCARDGQVRVGFLSSAERSQNTKRVALHKGSAHKLSVEPGSPNILKTAGEDAVVFNIDLRDSKPNKLITLHDEKNRRIALYSIHINPLKTEEFAVGGRDKWTRIYDTRKVTQEKENNYVKRFCPDHLKISPGIGCFNITCLMYNYNGSELLASYNDEDIYLFDTTQASESNYAHCYKGHRNSDTVKGVNFFGTCSEYVVSGSDCSHIYVWSRNTEEVVTFLKGDNVGVVNVLEPHPHYTVLATAGLDHDIKIWQPTGQPFSNFEELEKQIKSNDAAREEDRSREPDTYDNQLIHLMMRHLQRERRRYQRQQRRDADRESSMSDDASSETDDEIGFNLSSSDSYLMDDSDDDDEDEDDGEGRNAIAPVNCVQS